MAQDIGWRNKTRGRLEITRPGTMRRKFEMNAQRHIWVHWTPTKRSREEKAGTDSELLSRANSFGGAYQPLEERAEEAKGTTASRS